MRLLVLILASVFAGNAVASDINERFERWEEGSEEAENKLVETLKFAFKKIQADGATNGKLHRGTHAKGTCALAAFEVFDIADANLKIGLFKTPSKSAAKVRFANGSGKVQADTTPDARSLSVAVFSKYGRQDFSMNNDPIFPIPTLSDFVLQVTFPGVHAAIAKQVADEGLTGPDAQAEIMKRLAAHYGPTNGLTRLGRIRALGQRLTDKAIWSYDTQEYWTGTALSYGAERAAKLKFSPCDKEVRFETPAGATDDYLQDGVKNASENICFNVYVQLLDADVMRTPSGEQLEPWQWVEDAGLDWDAAGAPYAEQPVAQLTVFHDQVLAAEDCDHVGNAFNINANSLGEHQPLGGINRGRTRVEKSSQDQRGQ